MTIDIPGVPNGTLVPFMWIEVEPTPSPLDSLPRILIIGARVGGIASDNTPYILGDTTVEQYFGRASQIAQMYRHMRALSPIGEIWGISYTPDPDLDSYATAEMHFAGATTTVSEFCTFSIGEQRIRQRIPAGSTASDAALLMKKAINGNKYCQFTADVETDPTKIALTCRWRGTSGNNIFISTSRFAEVGDYARTITTTQPSGGLGGHDIQALLDALGDLPFRIICSGFSDAGVIALLGTFLDGDTGRWSPGKQLYGHAVVGKGVLALQDAIDLGALFNDPHTTVLGFPFSKSPEWCWAAELAALMQVHYANPPEMSRPLQTLTLDGVDPTFITLPAGFSTSDRQALLEAGIATVYVDRYNKAHIERDVTLYKTNVWGDMDASWRDATTMFQTMYFVEYMRSAITGAYPRAALSDADTGINGFCSPGQAKDTLIHAYADLVNTGLVENLDLFAKKIVVERNPDVATRLDCLLPPDMVNQLRIFGALVQTHLQLTDADFPPAAS